MFPSIKLCPSKETTKRLTRPFYVRVYDRTKTPKEKKIPTHTRNRREAGAIRNQIAAEILSGVLDPWAPQVEGVARQGPMTFSMAVEAFLQSRAGMRKATRDAYADVLHAVDRRLPAGLRLDAVVAADLLPYLTEESVSDATRHHRKAHLQAFFRWSVKKRLLPASPLDDIALATKGESAPVFFTRKEYETLVRALDEAGERWLYDAVVLALHSGLRRGELCALRWEGVDLDAETVRIPDDDYGFRTKTGRDAVRSVFGEGLEVLRRLASERPPASHGSDVVLRSVSGKPLYPPFLSRRFKAQLRRLGMREALHFHSLRHTCGTWFMQAGAPEAVTAKMLGHSSTQVTRKYTHAMLDDVRAFGERAFGRA